jgi:hypothetical protein
VTTPLRGVRARAHTLPRTLSQAHYAATPLRGVRACAHTRTHTEPRTLSQAHFAATPLRGVSARGAATRTNRAAALPPQCRAVRAFCHKRTTRQRRFAASAHAHIRTHTESHTYAHILSRARCHKRTTRQRRFALIPPPPPQGGPDRSAHHLGGRYVAVHPISGSQKLTNFFRSNFYGCVFSLFGRGLQNFRKM